MLFSFMKYFYVYILQSRKDPERYYTGFTEDLQARIRAHNGGECQYTAKFTPWILKTAVIFTDHQRAMAFEKYLKSASGRAFVKKRL
ncbi:MAG: GIY-YIG nuclease family protein [Sedimentisphaerales bacterium]|nr:GIY-YIG nuclease family protein [Sedimentisphaerales bacterium]